ncbi:3-methyl-2-oxobutanoate hydroxymethyltransferase [Edaphobacter dinghuensis]|uniref:3-methyl-2-oxobutanoate hydroxymethyltransferase n=1 Tax=Edaphobacter dinghuensis TaxID=1560005 RepID=A0A917H2X1_9BACT|nr:3-methyl-2-oxobutanoate hydroxymethyltransferase [Edaphobacter dinghuensis]GGG65864.1 3-methyl-2-oxobutanoate hydroxymethyltransferase [Edaphobacter dinghuensis]
MSLTTFRPSAPERTAKGASPERDSAAKVTVPSLLDKKLSRQPITVVTAYDYASARLVDEVGLDVILVGDSLAMVMQGHENTLAITMDEMLLYTRGVRRAVRRALLVSDMPFGSYHVDDREGVANALRFVKEAGAEAVKVEGGRERTALVRRIVDAQVPVMGHLGLTPQSVHRMGGYKVQGKTLAAIEDLRADALALEDAGCFAIVLEGVPRELAKMVTAELHIPTIGIGAGPDCDGQVLVLHDMMTMTFSPPAKFVRRYADVSTVMREALGNYKHDVETRDFPSDAESYHLSQETRDRLAALAEKAG